MNEIKKAIDILKTLYVKSCKMVDGRKKGGFIDDAKTENIAINAAISALEKQLNGGWIPFKLEYDEDYNMDMLQGKIPDDEQEILVTNGKSVWSDTFM